MNLFLAVLLIYSLLLIVLGLRLSRSISGSLDFYVANRELGPGLIFSTLLAANIGAGSTVKNSVIAKNRTIGDGKNIKDESVI